MCFANYDTWTSHVIQHMSLDVIHKIWTMSLEILTQNLISLMAYLNTIELSSRISVGLSSIVAEKSDIKIFPWMSVWYNLYILNMFCIIWFMSYYVEIWSLPYWRADHGFSPGTECNPFLGLEWVFGSEFVLQVQNRIVLIRLNCPNQHM